MTRKLTITVDEDVYAALKAKVGPRRISRFLNDLARPALSKAAGAWAQSRAPETVEELLAEVDNDGC
jgi:predicted CopG family antitoxin